MIDLILLAAGPARRFGQEQLLGDAGGAPLYRRAFEAARQAADAMMGLRVLVVTAKGVLDAPIREFGFNKVVVPENRPLSASVAAGAGQPVRGKPVLSALRPRRLQRGTAHRLFAGVHPQRPHPGAGPLRRTGGAAHRVRPLPAARTAGPGGGGGRLPPCSRGGRT